MSDTESNVHLCWCGAKVGEPGWTYCSRECGAAEALARLTANGVSPTPVKNKSSPVASENTEMRATHFVSGGHRGSNFFDDACSRDGTLSIGEWDLEYSSTSTVSVSSIESLLAIVEDWKAPVENATPSGGQDLHCVHRRPAMSNLRFLEKSALPQNADLTGQMSATPYRFPGKGLDEHVDREGAPRESNAISAGEDSVQIFSEAEGHQGIVSNDDSWVAYQTFPRTGDSPSYATHKRFHFFKKASNRVLAKLGMPYSKRARVPYDADSERLLPTSSSTLNSLHSETSLETPASSPDSDQLNEGHLIRPCQPFPSTARSSPSAIVPRRRQRGRMVGDTRPELSTLTSPSRLVIVDKPKPDAQSTRHLHGDSQCVSEAEPIDDSIEIGPGRPVYFKIRGTSVSKTFQGEDGDGWDDFVAIQRMHEQSRKQPEQDCWGAPVW